VCSSSLIRAMASSDVLLASVAFDSLSPMRRCCHNSQRSSINCYLLCRTCSCGAAWRRSARKSHTSCLLPEHVSLAEGDRKLPHYWPRRHPCPVPVLFILSGLAESLDGRIIPDCRLQATVACRNHSADRFRIICRQRVAVGLTGGAAPGSPTPAVLLWLHVSCPRGMDWRTSPSGIVLGKTLSVPPGGINWTDRGRPGREHWRR